jgi:hypothetical protein
MSDLRGLIDAAKADGPSAAARAKVWAGVSTVVGAGSAASGAGSTGAGSMGAAKMLALGTLLGGSVTVGIGVMVLLVGRTPLGPTTNVAPPAPAAEVMQLSMPVRSSVPAMTHALIEPPALRGAPHAAGVHPVVRTSVARLDPARPAAVHATPPPAVVTTDTSDTLAREASALAEARGALARRDALSALQIVRSLRALPGCQLVPEELAVEAQALRGLGLDDDANAVETRLRARFPDSVLGR